MSFSPSVEGSKLADSFPFKTFCLFLDRVSSVKGVKRKKEVITLFTRQWASEYRKLVGDVCPAAGDFASFYPALRLLLPNADRAREAYGIREKTMARALVQAFGLPPQGSDVTKVLKNYMPSVSRGTINEDLGNIAYCVLKDFCATNSTSTISGIHDVLDALASTHSLKEKLDIINPFVLSLSAVELKWFVRIVCLRDLKLGISDKVLLSCLHHSAPSIWDVTQDLFAVCERIAKIDPKQNLSFHDCRYLKSVHLFTAFKPMLCSRVNSVDELCTAFQQGFSKFGDSGLCIEVKYDGERVQLHKSGAQYRFWSRSGREWSSSYGESGTSSKGSLTHRLHANNATFSDHVIDCILDGEMLAFDKLNDRFVTKASGFDVKHVGVDNQAGNGVDIVPCYIVFDILYLNGQLLTEMSLSERKRILLTIFPNIKLTCEKVSSEVENYLGSAFKPIDDRDSDDENSQEDHFFAVFPIAKGAIYLAGFMLTQPAKIPIARCFDTWVQNGAEGLIAKALCTPYTPNGRKNAGWWKLKPDYVLGLSTDLDCLIVGAYASNTAVASENWFSAFLCAVLDDEEDGGYQTKRARLQSHDLSLPSFLTFCQVSSGLKRDQLERINRSLGPHWRRYDKQRKDNIETEWLRVLGEKPDFWVPPRYSLVLQIHAAEMTPSASYSAGFTLRFPRVAAIREEKTWENVASISEIRKLYWDTKGKMVKGEINPESGDKSDESDTEDDNEKSSFSKATIACVSTKYGKTLSRPLASLLPPSRSPMDSTEIESSVFADLEFCLLISSRFSGSSYPLSTKSALEKEILKRGGRVVQNPCPHTNYVVTDRITAKISNLIEATRKGTGRGKEGGYDIVSTVWLTQCIQANRLLALRKDQVFAARPSTLLQLDDSSKDLSKDSTDTHSLCCSSENHFSPERLRVDTLPHIAENSPHRIPADEYTNLLKDKFPELVMPLCGVSIVLIGPKDVPLQVDLTVADLRSLQATVYGPLMDISVLRPDRTGIVTHAIPMEGRNKDLDIMSLLEEIRKLTGQSSLPTLVNWAWAVGCAAQKVLLPVVDYLA